MAESLNEDTDKVIEQTNKLLIELAPPENLQKGLNAKSKDHVSDPFHDDFQESSDELDTTDEYGKLVIDFSETNDTDAKDGTASPKKQLGKPLKVACTSPKAMPKEEEDLANISETIELLSQFSPQPRSSIDFHVKKMKEEPDDSDDYQKASKWIESQGQGTQSTNNNTQSSHLSMEFQDGPKPGNDNSKHLETAIKQEPVESKSESVNSANTVTTWDGSRTQDKTDDENRMGSDTDNLNRKPANVGIESENSMDRVKEELQCEPFGFTQCGKTDGTFITSPFTAETGSSTDGDVLESSKSSKADDKTVLHTDKSNDKQSIISIVDSDTEKSGKTSDQEIICLDEDSDCEVVSVRPQTKQKFTEQGSSVKPGVLVVARCCIKNGNYFCTECDYIETRRDRFHRHIWNHVHSQIKGNRFCAHCVKASDCFVDCSVVNDLIDKLDQQKVLEAKSKPVAEGGKVTPVTISEIPSSIVKVKDVEGIGPVLSLKEASKQKLASSVGIPPKEPDQNLSTTVTFSFKNRQETGKLETGLEEVIKQKLASSVAILPKPDQNVSTTVIFSSKNIQETGKLGTGSPINVPVLSLDEGSKQKLPSSLAIPPKEPDQNLSTTATFSSKSKQETEKNDLPEEKPAVAEDEGDDGLPKISSAFSLITPDMTEGNTTANWYSRPHDFYRCGFPGCSFVTNLHDDLSNHLHLIHTNKTSYPCAYCIAAFPTISGLLSHLSVEIKRCPLSLYKCNQLGCKYENHDEEMFRKHLTKTHSNIKYHSCIYCKTIFGTIDLLINHLKKTVIQLVECPYCRVGSTKKDVIIAHINQSHPDKPKKAVITSRTSCSLKQKIQGHSVKESQNPSATAGSVNITPHTRSLLLNTTTSRVAESNKTYYKEVAKSAPSIVLKPSTAEETVVKSIPAAPGTTPTPKTGLIDHLKVSKPTAGVQPTRYTCEHCNYQTFSNHSYRMHIENECQKIRDTALQTATGSNTAEQTEEPDLHEEDADDEDDDILPDLDVPPQPPQPRSLRCSSCQFTTDNPHNLNTHTANHKKFRFVCQDCMFSSEIVGDFMDHTNSRHPHINRHSFYMCSLCPCRANHQDYIEQHFKWKHPAEDVRFEVFLKHVPSKTYRCPHCPFVQRNQKKFRHHVKIKHGEEALTKIKSSRPACGIRRKLKHFSDDPLQDLNLDTGTSTKSQDSQQSDEFLALTSNRVKPVKSAKVQNTEDVLQKYTYSMKTRKFKCNLCKFSSGKLAAMKSHIRSCFTKRHKATVTSDPFEDSASVKTKPSTSTGPSELHKDKNEPINQESLMKKGRLRCQMCEFSCDDLPVFKSHIGSHKPDKSGVHEISYYICKSCGFTSTSRDCVRNHSVFRHPKQPIRIADGHDFISFESSSSERPGTSETKTSATDKGECLSVLIHSFHCDSCDFSTFAQKLLDKHVLEEHSKAVSAVKLQKAVESVSGDHTALLEDENMSKRKIFCAAEAMKLLTHLNLEEGESEGDTSVQDPVFVDGSEVKFVKDRDYEISTIKRPTLKCVFCTFTSNCIDSVVSHFKNQHGVIDPHGYKGIQLTERLSKAYGCCCCGKKMVFPTFRKFITHYISTHKDEVKNKDENLNLNRQENFVIETRKSPENKNASSEQFVIPNESIFKVPVQCPVCSFNTKVRYNLMRHLKMVHGMEKSDFKTKSDSLLHKKERTPKKMSAQKQTCKEKEKSASTTVSKVPERMDSDTTLSQARKLFTSVLEAGLSVSPSQKQGGQQSCILSRTSSTSEESVQQKEPCNQSIPSIAKNEHLQVCVPQNPASASTNKDDEHSATLNKATEMVIKHVLETENNSASDVTNEKLGLPHTSIHSNTSKSNDKARLPKTVVQSNTVDDGSSGCCFIVEKGLYQCIECTFTGICPSKLQRHYDYVHSKNKPFQCAYCHFTAVECAKVRRHCKASHQNVPVTVLRDNKVFRIDDGQEQDEHENLFEGFTKTGPYTYKCDYCDYTQKFTTAVRRHVLTVHFKTKPFKCTYCDYTHGDKIRVTNHCESAHPDKEPSVERSVISLNDTRTIKEKSTGQPENSDVARSETLTIDSAEEGIKHVSDTQFTQMKHPVEAIQVKTSSEKQKGGSNQSSVPVELGLSESDGECDSLLDQNVSATDTVSTVPDTAQTVTGSKDSAKEKFESKTSPSKSPNKVSNLLDYHSIPQSMSSHKDQKPATCRDIPTLNIKKEVQDPAYDANLLPSSSPEKRVSSDDGHAMTTGSIDSDASNLSCTEKDLTLSPRIKDHIVTVTVINSKDPSMDEYDEPVRKSKKGKLSKRRWKCYQCSYISKYTRQDVVRHMLKWHPTSYKNINESSNILENQSSDNGIQMHSATGSNKQTTSTLENFEAVASTSTDFIKDLNISSTAENQVKYNLQNRGVEGTIKPEPLDNITDESPEKEDNIPVQNASMMNTNEVTITVVSVKEPEKDIVSQPVEDIIGKGMKLKRIWKCGHCPYISKYTRIDVTRHMNRIHRMEKQSHPNNDTVVKESTAQGIDGQDHTYTSRSTGTDSAKPVLSTKLANRKRNRSIFFKSRKNWRNKPEFRCSHCNYRSYYAHNMVRHSSKHHGVTISHDDVIQKYNEEKSKLVARENTCMSGIYKCKHCSFSTSQSILLARHTRISHHFKTLRKAASAGKVSKRGIESKAVSVVEGTAKSGYKCKLCPFRSSYRSSIFRHARQKHADRFKPAAPLIPPQNEEGTSMVTQRCPFCDYVSVGDSAKDTSADIKAHIEVGHCSVDGQTSPDESVFIREIDGYKCKHCCDKKIRQLRESIKHIRTVHPEYITSVYKCSLCMFTAMHQSHVREHMMSTHPGVEIVIKDVAKAKKNTAKKSTNRTAKMKSENKEYKCPHCPAIKSCPIYLSSHIKNHFKYRPFGCSLCDYKAFQRGKVARHFEMVHKGEKLRVKEFQKPEVMELSDDYYKKYGTYLASKETASVSKSDSQSAKFLASQQKSHHSSENHDLPVEDILHCTFCPFTTADKHEMQNHRKTHYTHRPFHCGHCNYRGRDLTNCKAHHEANHRSLPEAITYVKTSQLQKLQSAMKELTYTQGLQVQNPSADELPLSTSVSSQENDQIENESQQVLDTEKLQEFAQLPSSKDGLFTCHLCPFTHKYQQVLIRHILKHTGGPGEEKEKNRTSSKKHKLEDSLDGESLPKKRCHDETLSPSSAAHKTVFKCTVCAYTTPTNEFIHIHVNKHLFYTPHKCMYCPFANARLGTVNNHCVMMHPGKKIAHKTEIDPEKEKEALKLYTVEKQLLQEAEITRDYYVCKRCSVQCKTRSVLRLHLMRHENYRPYSCNYCGLKQCGKKNLSNHTRIRHPEKKISVRYRKNEALEKALDEEADSSIVKNNEVGLVSKVDPENQLKMVVTRKTEKTEKQISMKSSEIVPETDKTRDVPNRFFYVCNRCKHKVIPVHLRSHFMGHLMYFPYKCHICDFSKATSEGVKVHYSMCHPEVKSKDIDQRILVEKDAVLEAKVEEVLQEHVADGPERFNCQKCPYIANKKSTLEIHYRKHFDYRPFKCAYCFFRRTDKTVLEQHITRYHPKKKRQLVIEKDAKLEEKISELMKRSARQSSSGSVKMQDFNNHCHKCHYISKSKWSIQCHYYVKHYMYKPYECVYCPAKLICKTAILSHITSTHPKRKKTWKTNKNVDIENEIAMLVEKSEIPFNFTNNDNDLSNDGTIARKRNLETETEQSPPVKQQKVDSKVEKNSPREELNLERTTHHGFTMDLHYKQTKSGCTYFCQKCDFKSKWKKNMKVHTWAHMSLLFKCGYCSYSNAYRVKVRKHQKETHSNMPEKIVDPQQGEDGSAKQSITYACHLCLFTTIYKTVYSQHLMQHFISEDSSADMDRFTFHCKHCNFETYTEDGLVNHLAHNHKSDTFLCGLCNMAYKMVGSLQSHFDLKHPGEDFSMKVLKSENEGQRLSYLWNEVKFDPVVILERKDSKISVPPSKAPSALLNEIETQTEKLILPTSSKPGAIEKIDELMAKLKSIKQEIRQGFMEQNPDDVDVDDDCTVPASDANDLEEEEGVVELELMDDDDDDDGDFKDEEESTLEVDSSKELGETISVEEQILKTAKFQNVYLESVSHEQLKKPYMIKKEVVENYSETKAAVFPGDDVDFDSDEDEDFVTLEIMEDDTAVIHDSLDSKGKDVQDERLCTGEGSTEQDLEHPIEFRENLESLIHNVEDNLEVENRMQTSELGDSSELNHPNADNENVEINVTHSDSFQMNTCSAIESVPGTTKKEGIIDNIDRDMETSSQCSNTQENDSQDDGLEIGSSVATPRSCQTRSRSQSTEDLADRLGEAIGSFLGDDSCDENGAADGMAPEQPDTGDGDDTNINAGRSVVGGKMKDCEVSQGSNDEVALDSPLEDCEVSQGSEDNEVKQGSQAMRLESNLLEKDMQLEEDDQEHDNTRPAYFTAVVSRGETDSFPGSRKVKDDVLHSSNTRDKPHKGFMREKQESIKQTHTCKQTNLELSSHCDTYDKDVDMVECDENYDNTMPVYYTAVTSKSKDVADSVAPKSSENPKDAFSNKKVNTAENETTYPFDASNPCEEQDNESIRNSDNIKTEIKGCEKTEKFSRLLDKHEEREHLPTSEMKLINEDTSVIEDNSDEIILDLSGEVSEGDVENSSGIDTNFDKPSDEKEQPLVKMDTEAVIVNLSRNSHEMDSSKTEQPLIEMDASEVTLNLSDTEYNGEEEYEKEENESSDTVAEKEPTHTDKNGSSTEEELGEVVLNLSDSENIDDIDERPTDEKPQDVENLIDSENKTDFENEVNSVKDGVDSAEKNQAKVRKVFNIFDSFHLVIGTPENSDSEDSNNKTEAKGTSKQ